MRHPRSTRAMPMALRAVEQEASLGRVLDFMRLMWGVNHGLTRMSKRMQRTLGVTGPQRLVVRIVGQRPGISAGVLAEVLQVHPSTLTGILRRLKARGAIERTSISDGHEARTVPSHTEGTRPRCRPQRNRRGSCPRRARPTPGARPRRGRAGARTTRSNPLS